MKNVVIKFGLISGAVSAALMLATTPFVYKIGFDYGFYIGSAGMLIAFLLVFFGIRSYRDNVLNGEISFLRALGVGLLITLISTVCYVITWEFVYFMLLPDFADKLAAHTLTKMQNAGKTTQEIAAMTEQMKQFKAMFDNPVTNALFAFIEPLPIGLFVTIVSSIILRKRRSNPPQNEVSAPVAS
ncbi:MAG TPA: DUF4199 domain-containing protein [Pyrinomonadaceae bacterium]